jgi:hypothetical protein
MRNLREIPKLALIAFTIVVYFNGISFAGNSKATVIVSAKVIARISQSIIHQEPMINVTEGDVKKGFIEIPSGTVLQITTNTKTGYALFFEGNDDLFEEVMVIDKGRSVALSPNGGFVRQSYSESNIEVKDLSYKLQLKEDIRPGTYPFPFRVTASLL